MREEGRLSKAVILYEMEKTVCGGFSGPIKIAYTFFGGLLMGGSNAKNELTIKRRNYL